MMMRMRSTRRSDTADMPVSGPVTLEISLETSLQTELIVSIQFSNYILGIFFAREKKNIFSHKILHDNLLSFIPNSENKMKAALIPFSRLTVRQTSMQLFHGLLLSNQEGKVIHRKNNLAKSQERLAERECAQTKGYKTWAPLTKHS